MPGEEEKDACISTGVRLFERFRERDLAVRLSWRTAAGDLPRDECLRTRVRRTTSSRATTSAGGRSTIWRRFFGLGDGTLRRSTMTAGGGTRTSRTVLLTTSLCSWTSARGGGGSTASKTVSHSTRRGPGTYVSGTK